MSAYALGEKALLGHEIIAVDHLFGLLQSQSGVKISARGGNYIVIVPHAKIFFQIDDRICKNILAHDLFAQPLLDTFSDLQSAPLQSGGSKITGILVFLINSTGTFPAKSLAKTFLPVKPSTIRLTSLSAAVFKIARAISSLNINNV